MKVLEKHVLKHVHGKYLRQFATPQRLPNPIKSDDELLKWTEFYGKDCFISVFYFKEWDGRNPKKDSVVIDVIYFDFDHETKPIEAYAEARLFIEFLLKNDIIPRIYFSGSKGFAVYIDIPDLRLNNPSETLKSFCKKIVERLNLKTVDPHIFGDVMRVSRLPGTINTKSIKKFGKALYCTPLDPCEIVNHPLPFNEIIEIAETGNPDFTIERHESIKVAKLLKEIDLKITARKAIETYKRLKMKSKPMKKANGKKVRPCILKAIELMKAGADLPHKARVAIVCELYHNGYSIRDIVQTFTATPDYDPSKTWYQAEHITAKGKNAPYKPFKCETLKELGLCDLVSDCPIKKRNA